MSHVMRFPRLKEKADKHTKFLDSVVEKLQDKYSKKEDRDVATLSGSIFNKKETYFPTGVVPIDCISCYGLGFPSGIVEIYGEEASAKSAILEEAIAEAQRRGYYTGLFPMEYSINVRRAVNVGINPKRLLVYDAETIEDIYEEIKDSVRIIRKADKTTPILIGWDTIAATPTRTELDDKEKGLETSDMGKFAAQMSKLFRRLVRFLRMNNVLLICINQTRTDIAKMWGSKETTRGGKALRFYAWIRIRLRHGKAIVDSSGIEVGMVCHAKVVKNKVDDPFKECKIPILWKKGIDKMRCIWEYGIDTEVFQRHGTTYRWRGHKLRRSKFEKFYEEHHRKINRDLRQAR